MRTGNRKHIVYLTLKNLLAPALQILIKSQAPGSVLPPYIWKTFPAGNLGVWVTLLPFHMMGPKFRIWVWSVMPLLYNLFLGQVCRDRAIKKLSMRETECALPRKGSYTLQRASLPQAWAQRWVRQESSGYLGSCPSLPFVKCMPLGKSLKLSEPFSTLEKLTSRILTSHK